MPTLEWIGKDKVINHHQQVPYRVLEERYTFGAEKSENMISAGIILRRSRHFCRNTRAGSSASISIRRTTRATRIGFTTTM
jgi:hypothetical protein